MSKTTGYDQKFATARQIFFWPSKCIQWQKMPKKSPILNEKIGLKTIFGHFWGHVWTGISMSINFPPTLITYYTFLGQKCSIDSSTDFSHFFTNRMTSESYTDSLKVISEGSMVEYLPVRSQGGPKIIIGKKYFRPLKTLKSLTPYPSPLCTEEYTKNRLYDKNK